jgi:hypothetical protein
MQARRAEGGGHEPDNLVVLCGAHHRAVHRRQLVIEGYVSRGLSFQRGDGTLYTSAAAVPPDLRAKITTALCNMGFARNDVQRALLQVPMPGSQDQGEMQRIVRAALGILSGAG